MKAIPDSATIIVAADVLSTAFGDERVLLNLRDGVYYGLEDVGARIWTLLQQPATLAGIRDRLISEYDVEPERCEHDVRVLIAELASRGLVEVRTVPGAEDDL